MAVHRVAADVGPAELGSYQSAARLILVHGLVSADHPRKGALKQVLAWADQLEVDLRRLFDYSLHTTAHHARLTRRWDQLDGSQQLVAANEGRRPFDRRRLAYLCLLLAGLHRSRAESSLADMVGDLSVHANAIEQLGFDATAPGHKDAVVDAVDWLVSRGALRVSDGATSAWARDPDRGDALFDIDHDLCAALFRPGRPLQHLASAQGLLHQPAPGTGRDQRRRHTAQQARRLLVEQPVVYYADVDPALRSALRQSALAEDLTRLTGLPLERRAEGLMLVDITGHFTDRRFPGRGGAVNRTAGLLLAKIADLREDRDQARDAIWLGPPVAADEQADLIARVDLALPQSTTLAAMAALDEDTPESVPADSELSEAADADEGEDLDDAAVASLLFVEHARLLLMLRELYDDFGPTSFTARWQADPKGLLDQALALLSDLNLVHVVPGGLLVRPAAGRYRNITAVLPKPADEQTAFDFSASEEP